MAKKGQETVGPDNDKKTKNSAQDDSKKQALNLALSQITKQFGDGSIMKIGEQSKIDVELFSSGSLALDLALGGGFPKGRIIEIYGPESSGKTTLALHAIAEIQKQGGKAAFIDAEHALDPAYARKIGVGVYKKAERAVFVHGKHHAVFRRLVYPFYLRARNIHSRLDSPFGFRPFDISRVDTAIAIISGSEHTAASPSSPGKAVRASVMQSSSSVSSGSSTKCGERTITRVRLYSFKSTGVL